MVQDRAAHAYMQVMMLRALLLAGFALAAHGASAQSPSACARQTQTTVGACNPDTGGPPERPQGFTGADYPRPDLTPEIPQHGIVVGQPVREPYRSSISGSGSVGEIGSSGIGPGSGPFQDR